MKMRGLSVAADVCADLIFFCNMSREAAGVAGWLSTIVERRSILLRGAKVGTPINRVGRKQTVFIRRRLRLA